MGIANGIRKQTRKIALERDIKLSGWAHSLKTATEKMDAHAATQSEMSAIETSAAWAVIGIFLILAFAGIYFMSTILIPVTLAVVVGMILGLVAEKLSKLGVPRILNAVLLSTSVALVIFLVINGVAGPLTRLAQQGPDLAQKALDRLLPFMEQFKWLHITPQTFESGPMSINVLLENTGSILHVLATNLTPALVQGLIFFAALLLFLAGRVSLRKALIMGFSARPQRLAAIRIINAVEQVLGFYFATASVIYAGLGIIMTVIAYFGGLSMPALWGLFAFISSFVPFLGITFMTASVAVAGLLTHDNLVLALAPAAIFFSVHLTMENLVFPAVMGRQLELNPFIVFIAIIFWTWMWGAVGAMLALPLSLIVMTIINEVFVEEKPQPQLP